MLKRSYILNLKSLFFSIKNIDLSIAAKYIRIVIVCSGIICSGRFSYAQLPAPALVGYYESWGTLKMSQAHANYNVIVVSFAVPKKPPTYTSTCTCDMIYSYPSSAYTSNAAFIADIDALHAAGKKVILSIGGANDPIFLANTTDMNTFITSMNAIFAAYSYKFDGMDLDLETTSMTSIPNTWTMSSPAAAQTNMVNAVKSIMANYQTNAGKKMLLTMAPEVLYVNGGISFSSQPNGGKFLPILDGLRNELDMLNMQLYNTGSMYGRDGAVYNSATGDFATSQNETVVTGFTLNSGKGTFTGIPANKIGFGLPANASTNTAGSGFLNYTDICLAVKYFKGLIAKPAGWSYTMTTSYPNLGGLMTWDINEDKIDSSPSWAFATAYSCAFPASAPVTLKSFNANRNNENILVSWETVSEINNNYYLVERSSDGKHFEALMRVEGLGTSVTGKKYDFTDLNNKLDKSYYRLAQYDFDGSVHYSAVVTVEALAVEGGLSLKNNPFEDVLIVSAYGSGDEEGTINIIDQSGKLIITKNIHTNQEYRIGEECATGFYILEYQSGDQIKRYKIVKK
ncbi:MAG TPA: glycosyl hydrolase family 18 protein [Cytophagaceae bacterium]|nr:glycosyl hydrolase family 18 protein [Cytophagaceae bacterium]